jgi:hypothetical protein
MTKVATTSTPTPAPAEETPDDFSSYLAAGAAYIGRGFEAEALRTADVVATLDACRNHLSKVLPAAAAKCNIGPDLAADLTPYLEHWLYCAAILHRVRATADGPFREALDILLDAIRKGADPVHVGARALELLAEARA